MKVGQEIISCKYVSTGNARITQEKFDISNEQTGYLAVAVVADNPTSDPTPLVELATTTNNRIYGALATFNPATQRCGVIRTGIVPFKNNVAAVAGDMGTGVEGHGTYSPGPPVVDTQGRVDAGTSGNGSGTVVGYTGSILWVDLDAEQATV